MLDLYHARDLMMDGTKKMKQLKDVVVKLCQYSPIVFASVNLHYCLRWDHAYVCGYHRLHVLTRFESMRYLGLTREDVRREMWGQWKRYFDKYVLL